MIVESSELMLMEISTGKAMVAYAHSAHDALSPNFRALGIPKVHSTLLASFSTGDEKPDLTVKRDVK